MRLLQRKDRSRGKGKMLRSGTRGGEGESSVHDWFLSSTSHSRIIWDRPNRQIEGIGYVSNGEERKSVSGRHGERECDLEPKRFYININIVTKHLTNMHMPTVRYFHPDHPRGFLWSSSTMGREHLVFLNRGSVHVC